MMIQFFIQALIVFSHLLLCFAIYCRLNELPCSWPEGYAFQVNFIQLLIEYIRYIKNNDPRLAYALHILNCRHEYGNINDTMTLLKQINTPTLLLPYEQMYIQSFHHNNELIPEQHPNEHNPMFDHLRSNTTHHNPPDT